MRSSYGDTVPEALYVDMYCNNECSFSLLQSVKTDSKVHTHDSASFDNRVLSLKVTNLVLGVGQMWVPTYQRTVQNKQQKVYCNLLSRLQKSG